MDDDDGLAFLPPPRPGSAQGRVFLFLQGPHGPFFAALARALGTAGAATLRAGFSAGDRLFWPDARSYLPQTGPLSVWPEALGRILDTHAVTDIVLYGDRRPIHATAIETARARGLVVHVFEEGYLRPYWATYERGGVNGRSGLMEIDLDRLPKPLPEAPQRQPSTRWGDMRQHIFWGAIYHGAVFVANRRYRAVAPHRDIGVAREFILWLRLLGLMPLHRAERAFATARIRRGGFPYHLALMQLAHDANFRHDGPFADMSGFIDTVAEAFARGAPRHHHLVFKAHPLEDGREPLRPAIARAARAHGIADRVHFVRGGKLARLLDDAASAVTVNSTAAQQALLRGLPVRALGRAVYRRAGLTSEQPLAEFFARPEPPDPERYERFRCALLASSQLPGGFYSARGRRLLLRRLVDAMLSPDDPHAALTEAKSHHAKGLVS